MSTTACTNPSCPVPGLELPDGATTCWRCGAVVDPSELDAALSAMEAGFAAAGWRVWNRDHIGEREKKFAIEAYRTSRAQLAAAHTSQVQSVRGLEKQLQAALQAGGADMRLRAEAEAEIERLRSDAEKKKHGHFGMVGELENTRVKLGLAEKRIAELEGAQAKVSSLAQELTDKQAECQRLQTDLATVFTDKEGVWFWQGDGHDDPGSLVCPVVMSDDTLRGLLGHAALSPNTEQADAQEDRKAQLGDEVWYCPFRTMTERETGRMVKVTSRCEYSFRVDDGRGKTWLRDDSYGITWWWSDPAAEQPSGGGRD